MAKQGQWKDATISRGAKTELDGDDLFEGVHRAVEWLRMEQPGGADIKAIANVADTCAKVAETLVNARNELRASKGLKPIFP